MPFFPVAYRSLLPKQVRDALQKQAGSVLTYKHLAPPYSHALRWCHFRSETLRENWNDYNVPVDTYGDAQQYGYQQQYAHHRWGSLSRPHDDHPRLSHLDWLVFSRNVYACTSAFRTHEQERQRGDLHLVVPWPQGFQWEVFLKVNIYNIMQLQRPEHAASSPTRTGFLTGIALHLFGAPLKLWGPMPSIGMR